jgi:hypothetical protein
MPEPSTKSVFMDMVIPFRVIEGLNARDLFPDSMLGYSLENF